MLRSRVGSLLHGNLHQRVKQLLRVLRDFQTLADSVYGLDGLDALLALILCLVLLLAGYVCDGVFEPCLGARRIRFLPCLRQARVQYLPH
jgi:hypothetical protein